jgi:hypothetical protein
MHMVLFPILIISNTIIISFKLIRTEFTNIIIRLIINLKCVTITSKKYHNVNGNGV